jgi:dTMP kinase
MKRGKFIVLEGTEGCGTSTQMRRLVEHYNQTRKVITTQNPTESPAGQTIRGVLRGEAPEDLYINGLPNQYLAAAMFTIDRLHQGVAIEKYLKRGDLVLTDRHTPSTLAYQSMENEGTTNVPFETLLWMHKRVPIPDLLFYVHIPPEISVQRMIHRGGKREVFEDDRHAEEIVKRYDFVMGELSQRGYQVIKIDGALPIEEVTAECIRHIDRTLAA